MRIGIFGGTFNPIHNGHLIIAEEARIKLKLDQVFFVPSFITPLKARKDLVSAEARFRMTEKAISNNKYFFISDFELRRRKKSYTIDTLREFKCYFPKDKLFFIAGSDNLRSLKHWRGLDQILALAGFVLIKRPGYQLKKKKGITFLELSQIEISSSDIRRRIRKGLSFRYLVPEATYRYIKRNKLYGGSQ